MSAAMEKAYRALKDDIFSGRYRPGDRLKERDICAALEVSRTPVREALRRLQADGLVHLEPRRGGVVTEMSSEEAHEIFSLGAMLESFACRLAASRATRRDVTELESLMDALAAELTSDTPKQRERYMALDHELHGRIVDIAASPRLAAMLSQTVSMPVLVRTFHSYSKDDLVRSHQQHRTIVDAISAGDAEWAEAAMRSHILVARSQILSD